MEKECKVLIELLRSMRYRQYPKDLVDGCALFLPLCGAMVRGLVYASCFQRRRSVVLPFLQRLTATDQYGPSGVMEFRGQGAALLVVRSFSTPPRTLFGRGGNGGGGSTGDGNSNGGSGSGSGGGGGYRIRRPDLNPYTGNNTLSNEGGGGGGGGGGPGRKRVNIYTNTTPYVGGTKGSRANAITIFPGNFMDDDDAYSDEEDDESLDDMPDADEVQYREHVRDQEAAAQALRLRRLAQNTPVERVPEIDARGRSYGRGGRKTAQARVWIQPGYGEIVINHRTLTDYFDRLTDREQVLAPFVATETCGAFDMQVMVKGGGLTGQAGAIRHGLARALNAYNPDLYRSPLKLLGYLTRDPRKVERKKVGHVKARKSPQWVRR
jgi:small subunit ribosomal protein S9